VSEIKKNSDVKVLVIVFFLMAFFLFLFMNPDYTGNVVVGTLSPDNIDETQQLTGTVSLSFNKDDAIPALSNVSILIEDSTPSLKQSDTITLKTFVEEAGKSTTLDLDYNDADGNWAWEDQTGEAFDIGDAHGSVDVSISTFSNLSTFDNADTYKLTLKLWYGSDVIDESYTTFEVLEIPDDTQKPIIENVYFRNSNGSSDFLREDGLNCSAKITEETSSSVTVSYEFWAKNDSIDFESGGTGSMSCTGDSWSTGKICNAVEKTVSKTIVGDWTCRVSADDGTNKNYMNSTSLLDMFNSPPILTDLIENITVELNVNYTLDLNDYFDDPDDHELIYEVHGNETVIVEIEDDGDVKLYSNETGNETIMFSVEDPYGATVDSNELNVQVISGCTPKWNCGNWTDCVNGVQTRVCIDANECDNPIYTPETNQTCEIKQTATCQAGDFCKQDCLNGDPDCSCAIQGGYLCGTSMDCEETVLSSSDSALCCSEPCVSAVNTGVEGGSGLGFGSSTSKILMGVGTVAGIVFVITAIIIIVIFVRRKNARAPSVTGNVQSKDNEGTIAGVTSTSKPETNQESALKPLVSKSVKIRPVNFEKMQKYIEKSLKNKVPLKVIKSELQKTGWSEKDIEHEISMERLKNYVKMKVNQGVSKKDIEYSLKMKGWKKSQIKEVMKDASLRPLF